MIDGHLFIFTVLIPIMHCLHILFIRVVFTKINTFDVLVCFRHELITNEYFIPSRV